MLGCQCSTFVFATETQRRFINSYQEFESRRLSSGRPVSSAFRTTGTPLNRARIVRIRIAETQLKEARRAGYIVGPSLSELVAGRMRCFLLVPTPALVIISEAVF